jgi:hypothetical protein
MDNVRLASFPNFQRTQSLATLAGERVQKAWFWPRPFILMNFHSFHSFIMHSCMPLNSSSFPQLHNFAEFFRLIPIHLQIFPIHSFQ